MQEYLLLYRPKLDHYLSLDKEYKKISLSVLKFVLFGDFRPWETDFLTQVVSCYNVSFIYHDFKNQMLYIGRSDWSFSDGEMHCPDEEEFHDYVNETNSCKMSVNNYLEFRKKWVVLKKELPLFAIIYRDDNDWVDCKGFDLKEEMELFVKSYQPELTH